MDEEKAVAFGKYMKGLREDRALTQEELAKQLNMRVSNISKLEQGYNGPSGQVLIRMHWALGIPLEELVEKAGIENMPPPPPQKRAGEVSQATRQLGPIIDRLSPTGQKVLKTLAVALANEFPAK